jgi:hypothetical protein
MLAKAREQEDKPRAIEHIRLNVIFGQPVNFRKEPKHNYWGTSKG